MKELFEEYGFTGHNDRNRHYSSTTHTGLRSTVYNVGGHNRCIHCNNVAKPVQEGDIHGYEHIGYRCDCPEAFAEMAELLAVVIVKPKFYEMKSIDSLSREQYLKSIEKLHDYSLPLNGKSKSSSLQDMIPRITQPCASDISAFWAAEKSHFIHEKHREWGSKAEKEFINMVEVFANKIIDFEKEQISSMINKLNQPLFEKE